MPAIFTQFPYQPLPETVKTYSAEITAGLHYNLALAHAWLREFDKSREWAARTDNANDGQKLMQKVQPWINDHEKRLKANGMLE